MTEIPRPRRKGESKSTTQRFIGEKERSVIAKYHEKHISFSFKFFDRQNALFNCHGTDPGWFLNLLDHLKEISALTVVQLKFEQRNHYDTHSIDWSNVDQKFTSVPAELMGEIEGDCTQFRLGKSKGRIQGFFISNTFYVVWLDPHHFLYHDRSFGPRTYDVAPLTPYEILLYENERLQQEVDRLNRDMDELWKMIQDDRTGS